MQLSLKSLFFEKITKYSAETKQLVTENANFKLGEITLSQVFGGMKGMIGMITETSKLDPEEGIRFRGYSNPELRELLPKAENVNEPLTV
jgi:citrate synthase